MLERLALGIIAVTATACTTPAVTPETPTLVSIAGHGNATVVNPHEGRFQFVNSIYNASSHSFVSPVGSTVELTVPWPTSIELFIDGKPLTKVDPPSSRNYQYTGEILNGGNTPAKWHLDLKTPFDVPFYSNGTKAYTLTVVNVSGSNRSAPLKIDYINPPIPYTEFIPRGVSSSSPEMHSGDSPSAGGNCPGGGQEQAYVFCWTKAGDPQKHTAGTTACSAAQAKNLLSNSYSGYSASSGACP